jgi:hypothetical protein
MAGCIMIVTVEEAGAFSAPGIPYALGGLG